MKYCCEEFAENTGEPDEGIEYFGNGTWGVNGCCHGGCFVLSGMKFCPFCAAPLKMPQEYENAAKDSVTQ